MQPFIILLSLLQASAHIQEFMGDRVMSDLSEFAKDPRSTDAIASTSAQMAQEFNLSDHRWQHRLVLIFAPSEQSSAYQQQMQQLQTQIQGLQERDLKLVELLGTENRADGAPISLASADLLRNRFGVESADFKVILIGKDGTEKQRKSAPVDPAILFQTIDAMPMRQQEIQRQR